jgi:hypothetical protein
MEIEEFLRACFAEDRAPTWTLVPYDCPPGCCAPEGWMGAQCRYCDPAPVYGGTLEAMTRSAEEHAEAIHQRSHVIAECDAKLLIVEWHQSWPVLVETPPQFENAPGDVNGMTYRLTQQIAWTTRGEYRKRFGSEPPTAPILRFLALPYADRPGYREEWRV